MKIWMIQVYEMKIILFQIKQKKLKCAGEINDAWKDKNIMKTSKITDICNVFTILIISKEC